MAAHGVNVSSPVRTLNVLDQAVRRTHARDQKPVPRLDLLRFGRLLWSKGLPGKTGTGNGEFNHPTTIAVDAHGSIHVVDRGNSRVQVFDNEGVFKYVFGKAGKGDGEFNNPFCVAVNSKGEVIVTDTDNARVQMFGHHGKFQRAFGSTASSGPWKPMGVVVNNMDRMIVVDAGNEHSIQTYNPDGTLYVKFDAETQPFTGHKYVAVDKRNNHVRLRPDCRRELMHRAGLYHRHTTRVSPRLCRGRHTHRHVALQGALRCGNRARWAYHHAGQQLRLPGAALTLPVLTHVSTHTICSFLTRSFSTSSSSIGMTVRTDYPSLTPPQ